MIYHGVIECPLEFPGMVGLIAIIFISNVFISIIIVVSVIAIVITITYHCHQLSSLSSSSNIFIIDIPIDKLSPIQFKGSQ